MANNNRGRMVFDSGDLAYIAEGTPPGTPAYYAQAHVTRRPYAPVQYRLTPFGMNDNGLFSIDARTGAVSFKASPNAAMPQDFDHDGGYLVTVTAFDGRGHRAIKSTVVVVAAANANTPVFNSGASATAAENVSTSTTVYTAQANDADSTAPFNTVHYSLAAGVGDNDRFNVNSTTGAVTFKVSPNYEAPADQGADNVYNITVTAADGGNPPRSTTKAVAITVTDVNDNTPVVTSGAAATTPEGVSTSTAVYTAQATDADGSAPNKTVTYSLSGTDAGLFNINPTSGAVTFKTSPDFETPADQGGDNVYDITVTATDGGNPALSSSKAVAITVIDVNEPPAGTDKTITTLEDTAYSFQAGDFGFSDPSDTPQNAFQAVKITTLPASGAGILTLNNTAVTAGQSIAVGDIPNLKFTPAADANGAAEASFTFQVQDNGGTANGGQNTDQSPNTITFDVTPVNDAPSFTLPNNATSSDEDAGPQTVSGFATNISPGAANESTQTVSFVVDSNTNPALFEAGGGPAIDASGQLTYTAAPDASGTATITVHAMDNGGQLNGGVASSGTQTFTITIGAVNDAPTATDLTQSLTIDEDAGATTLFTMPPTVSDIDSPSVTATLTVVGGVGVLIGAGGATTSGSDLVYTISGTPAAVQSALAAVKFDSNPDYNGSATVNVSIDDGAAGPQGTNPTGAVSITVNPINDAPTATNLTQSLTIAEEEAATNIFTVPPTVSDIDSPTVTATLTLVNSASGVLTGAGGGTTAGATTVYTITGSPAAVQSALAAVQFDSAPDYNGMTGVNVQISDGGNGPQGTNPSGAVTINVTAVNDAPTAANLTQSLTIDEDGAATNLFGTAPTVSDIDSPTVTATLTLTNANAGILTGATATGTPGVYTITGTPVAVQTALAAVQFDSAQDYNGTTSVTVAISDGASGPQGSNPSGTVSITVNAVNDAPTATNLTQSLTVAEDAAATNLFGTAPTVSDIDSPTVTATLTLANAAAGVLTGATATATSGVYTFSGSPAAVQSALAAVQFDSADNYNGTTSVTVAISDGASGPQGSNPSGTVSITVNAVNDAPTATGLTQSFTINEDAAAANLFTVAPTVSDIDSPTVTATLQLTTATGTLTGAGPGIPSGATTSYTITGSPAAVQAALAAVQFDSADNFNGTASVAVSISDGGNGPQGTNPSGTVSITVTSVNDAPAGTDKTISGTGPHTFTTADFGFTDPVDSAGPSGANAFQAVTITTLPTSGSLTLSGNPVTAGDSIQVAQIPNLVFTPDNSGATATFTFQVQDDGGQANGGVDLDQSPNTITLTPNSPPVIAGGDTASYSTPENSTAVATIAATDADNDPITYSIVTGASSPDSAKFTIDSTGQLAFITAPNFEAPDSAANSNTYTVQVQASDGSATDIQTITVNVTDVNEAPTASPDAVSATEAGGAANGTPGVNPIVVAPGLLGNDTDPDSGDTITVQGVAAGTQAGPLVGGPGNATSPYGTLSVQNDGAYSYTVNNNNSTVQGLRTSAQTLTDTFSYTIKDSAGLTSTTQITVTIQGQNDNPTAVADTGSATEKGGVNNNTGGASGTGNVLTNDTDPDSAANGETKTVQGVAAGSVGGTQTQNVGSGVTGQYGTLTLNAAGAYTYVVSEGNAAVQALNTASQPLTDTFTYTMKDAANATSTTTLTVSINGANDAPTAANGTATGNEDAASITVTLGASDPDSSITNYRLTSLPSNGTLYTNAGLTTQAAINTNYSSNTFYFDPNPNYSGSTSFQFTATDAQGAVSNTATETIDVSPIADQATLTVGSYQPMQAFGPTSVGTATNRAASFAAVSDISGGYVVAYVNLDTTSADFVSEINFQRYNSSGVAQGSVTRVTKNIDEAGDNTDGTVYAEYTPDLVKLPNSASLVGGGFLVTWERSVNLADTTRSIVGRIYDANGTAVGSEFNVALQANNFFERPAAAAFSNGSYVVVYDSANANNSASDDHDVFGQFYNANGTTTGAFQIPTTITAQNQYGAKVAALSDGGFIVTWTTDVDNTQASGVYDYDIHAQRYNAAGTPVYANGTTTGPGSEFTINQVTGGSQQDASVAALAGGGWVVVWEDAEIKGRIFNAGGGGGTEFTVNTITAGNQFTPNVVALPDGGFVVSWQTPDAQNVGDQNAQRFDATGAKVGTEFAIAGIVAAGNAGDQFTATDAIAALGNGDIVGAYSDTNGAHSEVVNIPGDGVQNVATPLTTLNGAVTDSSETLSYILSGFPTGTTFNYGALDNATGNWVISSASDINALKTTALAATVPTAGAFTLTIDARSTDTVILSDGQPHTSTADTIKTLQVGIHTTADPVFAAHDAGSFDLHLSAVADTAAVHIDALPNNGTIAFADGTAVQAGATLSAGQLAGLKFTPTDTTADHAANFTYTVTNGTSVDTETLPIVVKSGTNLTLTGTADKDVIVGGAGTDTLNGAGGGNHLTGGGGADHFVFDSKALADASGAAKFVDHVTDYSAAQGDTIDFTALFAATPNPSAHAADLVHVTEAADGTSATLSVNVAGPNAAAHWVEIAHLDGAQAGTTVDVALDAANPQQVAHLHVDAWAHA